MWRQTASVFFLSLFSAAAVRGQDLTAMAGVMGAGDLHQSSYAWQLEYRHPIGQRFAWSASWINEGHPARHHRDGAAAELWFMPVVEPDTFSLGVGAGAYEYADTRFVGATGYTNDHGTTPIFSVSATYYTDSPWLFRLTGNHINEANGLASTSLVAGVGYQIGWKHRTTDSPAVRIRSANLLTFMYGRTIVNSRSSEAAAARVLEYRRAIGRYGDWTLSAIDEGDPKVMHRRGIATQVWLVDAYLQRKLGVGFGVGPYFVFQREQPITTIKDPGFTVLVSPTISYAITDRLHARLTWNRVVSRNNRDADVIVCGLGLRWGAK